jgi:phage shock protein PspC (stress-responsive transcriptional regulator)
MSTPPPSQRSRVQSARERGAASAGRVRGGLARRGWFRPVHGRLIAGVCAGLARRFGVTTAGVRIVFVVSMLFPGPQFLLYILLWVLMPSER